MTKDDNKETSLLNENYILCIYDTSPKENDENEGHNVLNIMGEINKEDKEFF